MFDLDTATTQLERLRGMPPVNDQICQDGGHAARPDEGDAGTDWLMLVVSAQRGSSDCVEMPESVLA
jgi:hypothetical protein